MWCFWWKFGECKPAEEFYNAIQTALLALESLGRLEKWLNKKYDENWFVLTNNKVKEVKIIRNFIKEVRGCLKMNGKHFDVKDGEGISVGVLKNLRIA